MFIGSYFYMQLKDLIFMFRDIEMGAPCQQLHMNCGNFHESGYFDCLKSKIKDDVIGNLAESLAMFFIDVVNSKYLEGYLFFYVS